MKGASRDYLFADAQCNLGRPSCVVGALDHPIKKVFDRGWFLCGSFLHVFRSAVFCWFSHGAPVLAGLTLSLSCDIFCCN